jgi:dynein light intermediate chain
MTIDKYFPESLVQYSHISSSKVKPQIFDFIQKTKTTNSCSKSIKNLPFNKELIIQKNDSTSNFIDISNNKKFNKEEIEILNKLLPPRQYYDAVDKKIYYIQYVSLTPATRKDVYELNEKLDTNLQKHEARDIGLCPVRRKFYQECFDEIIRQISIECIERGILLSRIKEEINQTINTYKLLYTSSSAFNMRKILLNENNSKNMCLEIEKYKTEIINLKKKIEEERMLRFQTERQIVDQESANNDKIKELTNAHNLIINDLKSQIIQLTSKSIQQLKNN